MVDKPKVRLGYFFLLFISLHASARGLVGSCAEIFARLSPLPDFQTLQFLPPAAQKKLRDALDTVAAGVGWGPPGASFFSFQPKLLNGVHALQNERRLRVDKIASLRAERHVVRRKLRAAEEEDSSSLAEISALRSRKAELEREIQKNSQEINALTSVLMPLRERLGIGATYEAARETARVENMLMILRFQHPTAAGQAMHKGVGKGVSHKFHSAEDGVIAGLVPQSQRLSRKVSRLGPEEIKSMQDAVDESLRSGQVESIPYRVGSMVAVERNGNVIFVDETKEMIQESEIVHILGVRDVEGVVRPLVSDVDPFAFAFREGDAGAAQNRGTYGVISEREKAALKRFNRSISRMLQRNDPPNRYMPHGPENRNPNSRGVSGYPMTVFFPDGQARIISEGPAEDPDRNLKAFFEEARAMGFKLEANPQWGW